MKKILFIFSLLAVFIIGATPAEALTLPFFRPVIIKPEQQILVIANLINRKSLVRINFSNLKDAVRIDYTLTYTNNNIPEGVSGSITLNGEHKIIKDIFLGTCSAKSCINHNAKNIHLQVITLYKSGKTLTTNYNIH